MNVGTIPGKADSDELGHCSAVTEDFQHHQLLIAVA